MSRRTTVAVAFGLVVALGILLARHRPGPHLDRAAYDRIEPGMTQAQVEAILGGPPGDYGARDLEDYVQTGGAGQLPGVGRVEHWLGKTAFVGVEFDDQGIVTAKELTEIREQGAPPLVRFIRRLGL
jgi:outer membrane protein assembly factor BamE (lipoprotein component of BamABCDE complex)